MNEFENYPEYVIEQAEDYVIYKIDNGLGTKNQKITLDHLLRYYQTDARDIGSGCRTLGPVTGDWRMIDSLAQEILEWFKSVNIETLRTKAHALGMIPKF